MNIKLILIFACMNALLDFYLGRPAAAPRTSERRHSSCCRYPHYFYIVAVVGCHAGRHIGCCHRQKNHTADHARNYHYQKIHDQCQPPGIADGYDCGQRTATAGPKTAVAMKIPATVADKLARVQGQQQVG